MDNRPPISATIAGSLEGDGKVLEEKRKEKVDYKLSTEFLAKQKEALKPLFEKLAQSQPPFFIGAFDRTVAGADETGFKYAADVSSSDPDQLIEVLNMLRPDQTWVMTDKDGTVVARFNDQGVWEPYQPTGEPARISIEKNRVN